MKSSLEYRRNVDITRVAASISPEARNAAARLEMLGKSNKLDIQHHLDYLCCGFWLRSHKYMIYDEHKELVLTAFQQLPQFRPTNNSFPLKVYQSSQQPLIEMYFGAPGLLEYTSSTVTVTLPSNVLIGSINREDKNATVILGSTTTTLKAFDFDGHFVFLAKPGGKTVAEESIHNVVMNSSRIAKIRSLPGYSILEYKKEDLPADVRALVLATAIWLEIIERKKPRWRREGLRFTRS